MWKLNLIALTLLAGAIALTGCKNEPTDPPGAATKPTTQPATTATQRAVGEKPNIIFVLIDDAGWGDVGVYGQKHFKTPHLDKMAAEGMRFTNAYCGSTVCAPSRAALLAGQHTGHLYQRGNGGPIEFRKDPKDITIATLLKDAGYTTGLFGKSGLSCNTMNPQRVLDKGFDRFVGLTSHSMCHRHYPEFVYDQTDQRTLEGNEGFTGKHYISEVATAASLKWISENKDRPFFMHLALTPPHADLMVPEKYRAPYMGKFEETPNTGGYYKQQHPKATYAGMLNFIDQKVGEVLAHLEKEGIADNTIVFFASDNGPSWEGGKAPEEFDSNGPLRGGKRDLYEGGIRTPFIVWWPGKVEAGAVSDLPTAFWDFMPTACSLAGVDAPRWTDGISITPTLLGEGEQAKHKYLYWEFYEHGGKQAVRFGNWKGVRLGVGKNRNAPIELYDLSTDVGEKNNIADGHPQVVAQIAAMMDEAHTPAEVFSFERGFLREKFPLPAERYLPKAKLIDQSNWKVIDASSESKFNGRVAAQAIDGNPHTWWHTRWNGAQPPHPHHVTIDLGAAQAIAGFRVMARQDGTDNGRINGYAFYVSDDPQTFGEPVAAGNLEDTINEQQVRFTKPVTGQYVKLVARSDFKDSPYTSLGELNLLAE